MCPELTLSRGRVAAPRLAPLFPSRAYIRFPDELADEDSRALTQCPLRLMGPYVFRAIEQANQRIVGSEIKSRVRILLLLGSRGGERSQPVAMGSSAVLKERVCIHFC